MVLRSTAWHMVLVLYLKFFFQVPNAPFKSNSYLLTRLWIISLSSFVNFLLSDATLHKLDFT